MSPSLSRTGFARRLGQALALAALLAAAGCSSQQVTPTTLSGAAADPTAAPKPAPADDPAAVAQANAAPADAASGDAASGDAGAPPEAPLAALAQRISDELAAALQQARDTAATLEKLRSEGKTERAAISEMLRGIVDASPDVFGASAVWQPDAYDGRDADFAVADLQNPDTGQFVVYWARAADGSVKQSKVNHTKLVARSSWLSPMTSGKPYVSEPYSFAIADVAFVAATISVPILDPTGIMAEPLGVYSLDVPLHSVLAGLRPEALPKNSRIILVDRNNDLAADSDPSWQPGGGIIAPSQPFAAYLADARGDPNLKLRIAWDRKEFDLAVAPVMFNDTLRVWRLMMLTRTK